MRKYNIEFLEDFRCLSDNELLYQLTGNRETALKLGGINRWDEIIDNLSPARKNMAKAVLEMFHRLNAPQLVRIKSSQDIYEIMYPYYYSLDIEEAWVIALNTSSKVLRKIRISVGGLTSTMVDVRVVMADLLKCKSTSFVLVHNHPSGSKRPSIDDDKLTEALRQAGKLLNIKLIDHVIIARDTYYSYADEGRL